MKRCLTARSSFGAVVVCAATFAFISIASASVPKNLSKRLQGEVKNRNHLAFSALLQHWEQDYGIGSVAPLLEIAKKKSNEDADRYIALMGAAKIGGTPIAPAIVPFLKDPSWMIRSGALQALARINNPKTASEILPLFKDKALVVRLQAVDISHILKPVGIEKALVAAALDPINYHQGKSQWVPQHALTALVALHAKNSAKDLAPLLDKKSDPGLQRKTLETLRALRGASGIRKDLRLQEECAEWKKILAKK
ncbi:MAG: HEAT repeat domain-containing protein [Bdellovibrionota bacterium]